MAESAVTFVLNKLARILQEEEDLLRGFGKNLVWIKDEMERMRAFLKVADSMEDDDGDEEIKVWVKQVRDVAQDTEDVLDEFRLRLDHVHGKGFLSYFRRKVVISSPFKKLKSRRQIATEIVSIKTRIQNISEGFRRYRIKHEAGWDGASTNVSNGNNNGHDPRENALLIQEAELVGVEQPKRKVVKWLLEGDSGMNVISVVGMGGLGKTTLIKKVYDDIQIKNHFQAHVWINVSQSFRLEELLKDIIRQLFHEVQQPVPERLETMNCSSLKATINEFLKELRYVLVLDDVWNINDWEGFKYALPNNNNGSRVMLTTRVEEVASRSKNEFKGHMYTMEPLSSEESRILFCRKTFKTDSCPPHLIILSESILKKCAGLPLAIVAISGVLSTKDPNNIEEWHMVNRSLGVELESNHGLKSIIKILSLGFNDLPYYLRSCFLYLSIFPEDCLIDCMRLIRLWMAEGFVQEKQGMTPEEVANGYLNALFNRSMVQIADFTSDGRVKTCRVHDLIREMILSKSKDQIFVAVDSNATLPEKVRCLSIHDSFWNVNERPFFHLRSFFMFHSANTSLFNSYMPSFFGPSLKLLKVLDLTGAALEKCPESIGHLLNLRYLNMRNTKVKKLPKSIGNLIYLETLDLKGTNVTELPVSIFNLQKLRHLLVYRYNKTFGYPFPSVTGFKLQSSLIRLTSLQKLAYIEANQDSDTLIQEIGSLIHLRRLGITKLRKDDGKTLCSSIKKLCNLRSLSLQSIDEQEIIDLQFLDSPPEFLRFLQLGGRLEKLPNWVSYAHNLRRVSLIRSRLISDPLESLGALPNLVDVELFSAYDGEMLCFKVGSFQRLKKLWIDGLNKTKTINVEEGAMINLEELFIGCCELLKRFPSGVENLDNLRALRLYNMPDELTTMVSNSYYENGEFLKIAHIPEVLVYNLD